MQNHEGVNRIITGLGAGSRFSEIKRHKVIGGGGLDNYSCRPVALPEWN